MNSNTIWTKITIKTTPDNIEAICGILLMAGIEGVEIDDPTENERFLAAAPEQNWDYADESLNPTNMDAATIRFYKESFDINSVDLKGLGEISAEVVKDDWSDAWLAHYKPFKIGERVVIRPVWEQYDAEAGEIVFTIDPGHVFGTGQHESTALCIQLLEKYIKGGEAVLDVGCGSGILGIIARLLGAAQAICTDIDNAATKMAEINANLNDVSITTFCGNILEDATAVDKKYNIIIANIVADVIIALAPLAAKMLAKDGKFIVGGIICERQQDVEDALKEAGFKILETLKENNWLAFCCQM